jgi:hypothetical protein
MDCKKCNIPFMMDEDMFVCISCGNFFFELVHTYENDNMVYDCNNFIKYSRVNHFKDSINEMCGMQTKRIPSDIFNVIHHEFIPKNTVEKNIVAMRAFLKKKKFNCYIKITNHILVQLNLINPPIVSEGLMQTLILKFYAIEEKFNNTNCDRKNLLPNTYLLYRFLEELDLPQFFPFICLSKNKKLLQKYENIYNQLSL